MSDYAPILEALSARTGVRFRPASPTHLNDLIGLGAPPSVVEFYAHFEPAQVTDEDVRLLPIDEMLIENHRAVPGYRVLPHGYIVFATSVYGDGYCFDLNHVDRDGYPGIVIMSHETAEEIETAEQAAKMATPVAENLREFLEKVVSREARLFAE